MNVLIDTNIVIPMEDTSRPLDPRLAALRRLCTNHNYKLLIHPAIDEDIQRDKNEERRNIMKTRIKQYPRIPSPPKISDTELIRYGWQQSNDNDRVDNLLLHALCRGATSFLITNDESLHRKARKAGVQEQVHRLDQFLAFLNKLEPDYNQPPFGIEEKYLYEFDIEQSFFNSLRQEYEGFDQWYRTAATNERQAWSVSTDGKLDAICIYKHENNPIITQCEKTLPDDVLKLCTFKVSEKVRGRKLGERLLCASFKYASEHKIGHVYIEIYGEEHELLVSLCEDFGFEQFGKNPKGKDDVYVKNMVSDSNVPGDIDALEYAIKYFPNFKKSREVNKFIVPIQPKFHDMLFADISEISKGLFANDSSLYHAPANTIKKAYLCHAATKQMTSGDILLFYRSKDRQSVECCGVVEKAIHESTLEKVIPLVSKRTVYTQKEIEYMLHKETLVILFRLMCTFLPIPFKKIQAAGIRGNLQSIRRITHEQYLECMQGCDR